MPAGGAAAELDAVSATLRKGKQLLNEKAGYAALTKFERALVMVRAGLDPMDPKLKADAEAEAYRGMAMAHQLLGEYDKALQLMQVDLERLTCAPGCTRRACECVGVRAQRQAAALEKRQQIPPPMALLFSRGHLWSPLDRCGVPLPTPFPRGLYVYARIHALVHG